MDLRRLRYFVAVARAGSFSEASSVANITQPALSRQIQRLEDELGVVLFERDARGVALTEKGRRLLKGAEKILAEIEVTRQSLFEPTSDVTGTVVVGLSFSVASTFAASLLRAVREKYPGVTLRLIEESFTGFGDEWFNWIRTNRFDLALLHGVDGYPDLEFTLLAEEELFLIGRRRDDLGNTEIPFRRIAAFPLVTFPPNHALRRFLADRAREEGVALEVRQEADSWPGVMRLVRQGRGYTVNSRTAILDDCLDDELSVARIVDPVISRELVLVGSALRQPSAAVRVVHRLIGEHAKQLIRVGVLARPHAASLEPARN